MKVKFINEEDFTQETWKNENKKGQVITISKGDTFNIGVWSGCESVLTGKGEWICDVDCKEFKEMFEVVNK